MGFAGRSDYAAGKAQGHKIAHALADELGPQGIRVNCVAPGHIWSEQLEGFYRARAAELGVDYETVLARYAGEMALRRIVTPDEIANAALSTRGFSLASRWRRVPASRAGAVRGRRAHPRVRRVRP